MRMCSVLAVAVAAVVAILANSCKGGASDQETRPLPAPEPAPANTQGPTSTASDVREEPRRVAPKPSEPSQPSAPADTATDVAEKPASTGSPTGTTTDTPEAQNDAGAAATTTPTTAPAAPSPECLQRCQGAMQSCISAPASDAGLPGFGNVEVCRKAFETCQAACK